MVLGFSLKKSGSVHHRVCLHAADVPEEFRRLLGTLWELREVQHVQACMEQLSFQDGQPHRFDNVFTKLRALEQTDFAKVLLMDIDLLVLHNIDDLFKLKAPAALRRGMNDTKWPLKTGDPISGTSFWQGRDKKPWPKWSWGQGTGINAGVMLLQPNQQVFDQMLSEIQDANHPSHCRGNGPEQDYLSRYWSDAPWSYIGVEYNYQIHQMFFSLHPIWASTSDRALMLGNLQDIRVVHYSGVEAAKPWHRVLDSRFESQWPDRSKDDEYTAGFADEFLGHWLWVRKDRKTWEDTVRSSGAGRAEMADLFLGDDGEIYRRSDTPDLPPTRIDLPEAVTTGAVKFMSYALKAWFDRFEELSATFGDVDLRQTLLDIKLAEAKATSSMGAAQSVRASSSGWTSNGASSRGYSDGPSVPRGVPSPGWCVEAPPQSGGVKVSALCLASPASVTFLEGSREVFAASEALDGEVPCGLFAKQAGSASGARRFGVPAPRPELGAEDPALQSALSAISFWVDCVPPGVTVLLALVNVDAAALGAVLEALGGLGVPREMPLGDPAVLAAVGVRMRPPDEPAELGGWYGHKAAQTRPERGPQVWRSCHASSDVAYAAGWLHEDLTDG